MFLRSSIGTSISVLNLSIESPVTKTASGFSASIISNKFLLLSPKLALCKSEILCIPCQDSRNITLKVGVFYDM